MFKIPLANWASLLHNVHKNRFLSKIQYNKLLIISCIYKRECHKNYLIQKGSISKLNSALNRLIHFSIGNKLTFAKNLVYRKPCDAWTRTVMRISFANRKRDPRFLSLFPLMQPMLLIWMHSSILGLHRTALSWRELLYCCVCFYSRHTNSYQSYRYAAFRMLGIDLHRDASHKY
jgi:hypothetical protein